MVGGEVEGGVVTGGSGAGGPAGGAGAVPDDGGAEPEPPDIVGSAVGDVMLPPGGFCTVGGG